MQLFLQLEEQKIQQVRFPFSLMLIAPLVVPPDVMYSVAMIQYCSGLGKFLEFHVECAGISNGKLQKLEYINGDQMEFTGPRRVRNRLHKLNSSVGCISIALGENECCACKQFSLKSNVKMTTANK